MITVLLADDHPVVRAGLRAVLETAGDIAVVAEAATPDDAVAAVEAAMETAMETPDTAIDLVLMDLRFGEGPGAQGRAGGVDATARIRALPDAPQAVSYTHLTLPTTPYV